MGARTARPPAAEEAAPAVPSGIAYLVGRLDRLLRRRLGDAVTPLGLTAQQYTILAVLGARGQLSNAQLAERSFVTPQTANEMVKAMEERGWIERQPDPSHGRIIRLSLTRRGRELLEQCHAAAAELEERMLADLPPAERDALRARLKSCVQALSLVMMDPRS